MQSDNGTKGAGRDSAERTSSRARRAGLSHELLYGLSPDEFRQEARALQEAETLTPLVRERLMHRLIEHLKTPVDAPSWGPDWVRGDADTAVALAPGGGESDRLEARTIVRNLERSRQVARYRPLYLGVAILAVIIAGLALFVDYNIINGDVWTRALANQFMVVPDSLKDSLVFKSLQVIFAVLAVHFMLKITGAYGRNILITAAFVLTIVMVGCLGYLVAYNNMAGATQARFDTQEVDAGPATSTIDALFATLSPAAKAAESAPEPVSPPQVLAAVAPDVSIPFPKLSPQSLANAQGWFWLAFASGIFFIVTAVSALYMQIAEHNVRNFLIARDYDARRRQYAQLHLLELASHRPEGQPS